MTPSATITDSATASIRASIDSLIEHVRQGRIVEAIEAFYDDDVMMRENLNAPTVGKRANLEREAGFERWVATWHGVSADTVLVDGDHAVIHWILDYTSADGKRWHYDQLAVQRWTNGRIAEERFVYDPATVAVG